MRRMQEGCGWGERRKGEKGGGNTSPRGKLQREWVEELIFDVYSMMGMHLFFGALIK